MDASDARMMRDHDMACGSVRKSASPGMLLMIDGPLMNLMIR